MEFLLAAISLGFLGSFHCIGMCGPIALALPVHNRPKLLKYALIFLYNLGRITTYALLGLMAGVVGKSVAMAGFQQGLSIGIGVVLLASVFFRFKSSVAGLSFFLSLKTSLSKLFAKGSRPSLFIVGSLNGLLPCGLVYMGMAGATATGDVGQGMLFMTAFGLGTVPFMFALPLTVNSISISSKKVIRKVTPIVVTAMAVLLILRGLNLGIPYVSPKINTPGEAVTCHSQHPDAKQTIHCVKSEE